MKIKKYNESIKDLMKPISEEDIDGKLDKIYQSRLKSPVENDRVNTIYNIVNFLDNQGYTYYGGTYDLETVSEKIYYLIYSPQPVQGMRCLGEILAQSSRSKNSFQSSLLG